MAAALPLCDSRQDLDFVGAAGGGAVKAVTN